MEEQKMLSKEKLVKLLSGMYYNATGNLASLEFLESKSWADLQAIYDSEVQRTLANNTPEARAARQTTLELENERVRFQAEKMQREYLAQQNPPADPKENRKIFSAVCRQCGISENDANFSILVQACSGDLFDSYVASQAAKKNPGAYVPATPQ